MVVAEVPKDSLPSLHVSKHPIASQMDVESNNYIIPRDGSFAVSEIKLDDVPGDLSGSLANVRNLLEARQRIQRIAESLGGLVIAQAKQ